MACSVADVIGALGDKWGILIMRDIVLGLTRFEDLRRSTDATNATLSDRLKMLQEAGLVVRVRYQSKPDRYEYRPTDRGRELGLLMQAAAQIGDSWNLAGREGPPIKFIDRRSGRALKLALVDGETNEIATRNDVLIVPGAGADDKMRWRLRNLPSETQSHQN